MHNYIANKLIDNGYYCFLVGGAVRDHIRGVDVNDYDLATNAIPTDLRNVFCNDKLKHVGETFNVTHINSVEVATFRSDEYDGDLCVVSREDNIFDDLSRRDFTVNAMARNMLPDGDLIDPFGGVEDIATRTIKFVGNPYMRIHEDPNRIIRAFRFCALLGGTLDSESERAITDMVADGAIDRIAPERIRLEILKAMRCKTASVFFEIAHRTGALVEILPSLAACVDHTGGPYHAETVFEHCMDAGDFVSTRCPLTKLAAYLHDVGKPFVYEDGSFIGHEKEGEIRVGVDLAALKFSNREINMISTLVRYHMGQLESIKSVRKLVGKLLSRNVHPYNYLRIKLADRHGNRAKSDFNRESITQYIDIVNEVLSPSNDYNIFDVKSLDITGYDVMRLRGIHSGKEVGDILKRLYRMVVNEEIENDHDVLVEFVTNITN